MGVDFTTETERKRCKQIDKCQEMLSDVTDALGFGIDTSRATRRLIKLRNYLNRELPDKRERKAKNNLRHIVSEMEEAVNHRMLGRMTEEERRIERFLKNMINSWSRQIREVIGDKRKD